MSEERIKSLDELQDSLKKQIEEQIRTELIKDEYKDFSCVLIISCDQNGRLDIMHMTKQISFINAAKGLLYNAIDQLNRIQLLGSMFNKQQEKKGA